MIVEYRGFVKRFGGVVAADGVDLVVPPSATVALIGPNGSGKTTTLKALLGLVRPTAGRVLADGVDVAAAGAELRRRIGYLPQRLSFPEGMRAGDVIRLYARLRGAEADPIALLRRVELAEAADRAVDGFSGGMRQRLGLAVALIGSPELLVLDEPSAALDPSGALLVRDLIAEIRGDGTGVLLCSHDLAEVQALADRVAVFVRGRVCATGSPFELAGRGAGGTGDIESIYRAYAGMRARSVA
jgi:ABC-2 type transport system ATP-binding protein